MPTLLNPSHSAAFDAATDKIVLTFRDGREVALVVVDADAAPALINSLMNARSQAKLARRPPPAERAPDRPERPAPDRAVFNLDLARGPDLLPVRRARPSGVGVVGTRGPSGGRVRRS